MKNKNNSKMIFASVALSTMVIALSSVGPLSSEVLAKSKSTKAYNASGALNLSKCPDDKTMKTKLDILVKEGTLTQTQEDKILSYKEQKCKQRKDEKSKIKNMTEDQRKAYFQEHKDKKKSNMFKELVDQKVITKDQADAIRKSMPRKSMPRKPWHKHQQ